MGSKKIGNITVTAKEWKKGNQHRIYFAEDRRNGAQACWDINKREWVKVHGEFGYAFKNAIKEAFNL
jgi:hypothetical protein